VMPVAERGGRSLKPAEKCGTWVIRSPATSSHLIVVLESSSHYGEAKSSSCELHKLKSKGASWYGVI
jgi:hypothetical protein